MVTMNKVEILLVEDNPSDAELTLRALKQHNFADKVHVAKDGAEALEYIFGIGTYAGRNIDDKPKVILLDLKLPKIDGLEVLRKVKSDNQTKTIPVVVLTSSTEERDIIKSYELGVNSYIIKPIDFDELMHAVSDIGLYWMLLNRLPSNG